MKERDFHVEPNLPADLRAGRFFLPEGDLFVEAEKKKGQWVLASFVSINRWPREVSDQEATMQASLLRVRDYPVPLPKTTPYDSDPTAREVYLKTFQHGYRNGMARVFNTLCGAKWKYMEAEQQGWGDGQSQAVKDHPELL